MIKKYLPKSVEGKMIHVVEECSEVQHAITKALRFGLDKYHPRDKSYDNRNRILNELDDLESAIGRLRDVL